MRIVQVNQSCVGGGGFIQPLRLHRAFRQLGHDARLVVLGNSTDEPGVTQLIRPNLLARAVWRGLDIFNSRGVRAYPKQPPYGMMFFDAGLWLPAVLKRLDPDVILLNFFNCLMAPRQVRGIKRPLFWTMHDFSPFTGGCHLAEGCVRYREGCGKCPAIGSIDENDITTRGFAQREEIWSSGITGVAVGTAQAVCAKSSLACNESHIETIPNGVPLDVFQPERRVAARRRLGFDEDKNYIMVGTSANQSPLKGGVFAEGAARRISERFGERVEFAAIGNPPLRIEGASVRHLGVIREEHEMADLYSACDLVLFPSLIEMCPLTVLESMACGTPVVSFKNGGAEDIITNGVDGYLIDAGDSDAFLHAIEDFINMPPENQNIIREAARHAVEKRFDILDCAHAYLRLFEQVLEGDNV